MNFIDNQASITIYNCNFGNIESFCSEFRESKNCQKFSNTFKERDIIFKRDDIIIPTPQEKPIVVFADLTCHFVYDNWNKIIQIKTEDYYKDKDTIVELLNVLAQFRLQEISSVRIDFASKCNNGNNRLNVFNSRIHEKVPNWIYNVGFNVRIPIQNPDCNYSEDYRFSKVENNQPKETSREYIYQVVANYLYKITEDKANSQERLQKLTEIKDSVESLKEKHRAFCEGIMSL